MKSICSIILFISSTISFANNLELDAIVWYEGSSFYKSLHKKKKVTLYFSKWENSIPSFIEDENYDVAIQLDEGLTPFENDDESFFNLNELSRIDSEELIEEYLQFLENFSRTKGISYLVLPDSLGKTGYEKEVLESAVRKSPYFFISKSLISESLPQSKREFNPDRPTIWVSKQTAKKNKFFKWKKNKIRK